MSLAKISRKLRRKYRVGKIKLLGAEQTARDVVGKWRSERDTKLSEWVREYSEGVREADTTVMESNLAEWYKVLDSVISPKLKEIVPKIYAEAKGLYTVKKKVKVPVKA
jgi:hypothetical protein